VTSFKTPAALRAWLEKHHATADELVVRIWKVHAAARGVTNKQAVDEALCFGWIDGIRRSHDADSFIVRFTPRKPTSNWSAINIRRFGELDAEGRVRPAGRAAFTKRDEARSRVYSFEQKQPVALPPAMEKKLRANKKAAAFWDERPPWYRKVCAHWVLSPKREETRDSRLATLIACSARGEGIPMLYGRIGGKTKKT
jgi:uncharacterized protein YdeI (YjbR/CyaY-like superfamily)